LHSSAPDDEFTPPTGFVYALVIAILFRSRRPFFLYCSTMSFFGSSPSLLRTLQLFRLAKPHPGLFRLCPEGVPSPPPPRTSGYPPPHGPPPPLLSCQNLQVWKLPPIFHPCYRESFCMFLSLPTTTLFSPSFFTLARSCFRPAPCSVVSVTPCLGLEGTENLGLSSRFFRLGACLQRPQDHAFLF